MAPRRRAGTPAARGAGHVGSPRASLAPALTPSLGPVVLALLVSSLHGAACTIDPGGEALPAPDIRGLYVFYPRGSRVADGLVRGRGLPGTMPTPASHALVESHPTGNSRVVEVDPEGGIEFEIIALSGDVLEIRAATSARADILGAPAFVRVPASFPEVEPWVCCAATNMCMPQAARDGGAPCPDRQAGVRTCVDDADCGPFENEYLPLAPDQIRVSVPNARGRVSVEGTVVPNVLVALTNIGKSALAGNLSPGAARRAGLDDPGVEQTRIADDRGRFRFEEVPAIADDELILQLFDLRGFRSPAYARRVDDPPLAGVDVLGVFAFEPLTNGQRGTIAVRLSPHGDDGRGICPDRAVSPDGLELCAGGGLDHAMVRFDGAYFDAEENEANALAPLPTPIDANTPHNRGVEGNVWSRALDLFLVLDRSAGAAAIDGGDLAKDAIRDYVRYLRARDRVGLITFGGGAPALVSEPSTDRGALLAALDALPQARAGLPNPLDGVELAANRLAARSQPSDARVVVVAFEVPAGAPSDLDKTLDRILDVVEPQPNQGFDGFPVDIVGVQVDAAAPSYRYLADLATFSQGRLIGVSSPSELRTSLADLRGQQAGGFVLLYDVDIPDSAGKAGTVFLDLTVTLPGSSARSARYEGPLRVANAP